MTDKELLELAAKAAGITITWFMDQPRNTTGMNPMQNIYAAPIWNPLTDDGDAFRLATKLDMNIFHTANKAYAMPSDDDGEYQKYVSYKDAGGKDMAVRRAIVLVAAEIGKTMP